MLRHVDPELIDWVEENAKKAREEREAYSDGYIEGRALAAIDGAEKAYDAFMAHQAHAPVPVSRSWVLGFLHGIEAPPLMDPSASTLLQRVSTSPPSAMVGEGGRQKANQD